MEKEGLDHVLSHLHEESLDIDVLVTDRHRQINKWLRENHQDITHYYDVWHVAKGVLMIYIFRLAFYIYMYNYNIVGFRKKLEAASEQKDCDNITQWQRSIINHLYWCIASTPDGDGETIKTKWLHVLRKPFTQYPYWSWRIFSRMCTWTTRHS